MDVTPARWCLNRASPPRSGGTRLRVVLEPLDEGGYTVYVPALPGCISEGDSREEALDNIREAIQLYLEPSESQQLPDGALVEELVV